MGTGGSDTAKEIRQLVVSREETLFVLFTSLTLTGVAWTEDTRSNTKVSITYSLKHPAFRGANVVFFYKAPANRLGFGGSVRDLLGRQVAFAYWKDILYVVSTSGIWQVHEDPSSELPQPELISTELFRGRVLLPWLEALASEIES